MWDAALAWLAPWGLWGVAAALFLEGMGMPLPVELAFIAAGALIQAESLSVWQAVAVGWAGAVAGNLAGYAVAVAGGRPLVYRLLRVLRVPPRRVTELEQWVQQHGMLALLVTRLTHWGFAPTLWLAGIMRMPPPRLLLLVWVGDLVWVTAWIMVSMGLVVLHPAWMVAAVAALAVLGLLVRRLLRRWGFT